MLNFIANQIEAKYFQFLRLKDRFFWGGMSKETRENHSLTQPQSNHAQSKSQIKVGFYWSHQYWSKL